MKGVKKRKKKKITLHLSYLSYEASQQGIFTVLNSLRVSLMTPFIGWSTVWLLFKKSFILSSKEPKKSPHWLNSYNEPVLFRVCGLYACPTRVFDCFMNTRWARWRFIKCVQPIKSEKKTPVIVVLPQACLLRQQSEWLPPVVVFIGWHHILISRGGLEHTDKSVPEWE